MFFKNIMFNLFQIYYFTDIFFKNSMLEIKNSLVRARNFHPCLLILSKEGIFFFSLMAHIKAQLKYLFIAVRPRGSHDCKWVPFGGG